MAAPEAAPSLIFEYASVTYEEEDTVEKEMALAHQQLIESFQGKSDHEIHNFLQEGASASMARHGEIINGLLYGILTNKGTATDFYRHMNFVSRDQLASAGKQIRYFCIHVHFQKFRQTVKEQLVWIVGQLTELRFQGCENLYMNLLKQIRGGDISTGNIQHAEAMLNLLNTHLPWVYNNPVLIAYSCFTYLRIILDHSRYPSLKQAEITFCTKLLRERFRECSDIGRDLVRALQDVSRIKEFEEIWTDLLHNPENLNPQLDGIHKLMAVPSRDFILGSRLTFDMERKLLFILKTLNVGDHIRNTTWFYERYLAAPEADALFSDIIRYICGVYHPTNAVLASSIVPRWLFIATLLRYVRSNTTASNIKLALFYDWLFYDPARDSIMNIEPAMLLMERSLMREPWVTAILVEFLHFTVLNYHPTLREVIQKHVGMAMQVLVDKQVIKKIGLIYQAPILNEYQSIKEYILTLFPHQLAAEGISNIQINNTAMESLDENHQGPGAESDDSEGNEDFETGSLSRPYDNQITGGDEDTLMSGGRNKERPRSRDNSRESSHEPMQVDELPVVSRPAPPSTQNNDEEEPIEDEVMESAVVESSTSTHATAGAETIIPNWNFPSPTTGSGGVTSKDGDNPATPVPGASLWIFGSSLQDFKKAYELAPDAPETGGMFRKIWDIYSDVGGANVEGADLANEIGSEICAYAQKADVPADYLTTFAEDNQGVLDALISCLWRVMDREGEDGALRVAQMFMRSEVNVSAQDRLLGMWYLLGLIKWHMRSAGTASLTFEQVLDLYASYLQDSAAQEQARGETESESVEGTEQMTVEMAREFLTRDLQHLQDRQLGTFDTVLPLILQHLPDLVPKNEQFLRLVLAMASPIQIYGLSMGLSRRDFILLSTPVSAAPTSGSNDSKASNSKGKSKNASRTENSFSTLKDILAGEWEPKVTLKMVDTLGQTLDWETFEQMGVWQLVQSEFGGDAKAISRILRASWIPGMTQVANSEALNGLMNLIRALSIAPPNLKMGKALAHVAAAEDQVSNDMMYFSQSCAARWASSFPDHLAALLMHLSDKNVPQDQVSEFSIDADADVDMHDISGNSTSKTTRSSRSKVSSPSASISKVKLTAKQRKQQGLLLQGLLRLLKLWWNDISEKNARQSFFRVWSTQVRNQVRDALVENFGSSNLAVWPEQWWQKGDEAKKSSSAASRRKGGRRGEKSEEDEDEDEDEDGDGHEDSDEDEEKSKSESEDEDRSEVEDADDTKTRSKAKGGVNTKTRKRPHNDGNDEEEGEEEQSDDSDDEEEASSESEKKTRQSAKGKKRFGGAADSLSSSTSSSRRNSPKAGAKSNNANSKTGVLNSRASTRNKSASAASSTSGRRAPVLRRAKPDTRKRKISDDDDEEEEQDEEEDDEDEEEEEGDDDEEDEEEGEEDGEEGDQDSEENDKEEENNEEQEDAKTLKPMLYSQRRAAASANSKLMSKGNAASSNGTSSSSSSSANSSANSTPNPNAKAKASANMAANKKRGKPKRRIMSEDESDE
ncbi:Integrator complex subunit 3 [Podila epicladia]|nr:Integrator complex subunit 3 [Podila epicladia]KAG0100162.1 Integrator complex subunit 3 [Podila epicladia]